MAVAVRFAALGALFFAVAANAMDEECVQTVTVIQCYTCDSRKHSFCGHTLNVTKEALGSLRRCKRGCVKWIRQEEPGNKDSDYYIQRLCSEEIEIKLYVSPNTCIRESRPGSGRFCICDKPRCNGQQKLSASAYAATLMAGLVALSLRLILNASANEPKWRRQTASGGGAEL